jgi:hypothetical protein
MSSPVVYYVSANPQLLKTGYKRYQSTCVFDVVCHLDEGSAVESVLARKTKDRPITHWVFGINASDIDQIEFIPQYIDDVRELCGPSTTIVLEIILPHTFSRESLQAAKKLSSVLDSCNAYDDPYIHLLSSNLPQ